MYYLKHEDKFLNSFFEKTVFEEVPFMINFIGKKIFTIGLISSPFLFLTLFKDGIFFSSSKTSMVFYINNDKSISYLMDDGQEKYLSYDGQNLILSNAKDYNFNFIFTHEYNSEILTTIDYSLGNKFLTDTLSVYHSILSGVCIPFVTKSQLRYIELLELNYSKGILTKYNMSRYENHNYSGVCKIVKSCNSKKNNDKLDNMIETYGLYKKDCNNNYEKDENILSINNFIKNNKRFKTSLQIITNMDYNIESYIKNIQYIEDEKLKYSFFTQEQVLISNFLSMFFKNPFIRYNATYTNSSYYINQEDPKESNGIYLEYNTYITDIIISYINEELSNFLSDIIGTKIVAFKKDNTLCVSTYTKNIGETNENNNQDIKEIMLKSMVLFEDNKLCNNKECKQLYY